jgi:hypothetical protein
MATRIRVINSSFGGNRKKQRNGAGRRKRRRCEHCSLSLVSFRYCLLLVLIRSRCDSSWLRTSGGGRKRQKLRRNCDSGGKRQN